MRIIPQRSSCDDDDNQLGLLRLGRYDNRSYQDDLRDCCHDEWKTLITELDRSIEKMWKRVDRNKADGTATYAYVCLVYGNRVDIIAQAIACCNSIHKTATTTTTNYPVICLYTDDVPIQHIAVLNAIFDNTVCVPIIYGASSLYKKDWFREVFTKLHIFNPDVLPYTTVLFLDCDICVLKPIHDLFDLRSPAAMENSKWYNTTANDHNNNHRDDDNDDDTLLLTPSLWLKHGQEMNGRCWLINAGVILVSPDKDIFNLLKEDVTTPHRHHLKGMTPEQYYLAGMLAPYLTHIDQSYNFEIQLHGGVPLTHKWQHMSYDDIKIVHYSGGEIQSSIYPQVFLGRQDKYMPKKLFNTLPWDVQDLAHHRAKAAWIDFNINLAQAAAQAAAASTTVKKTRDGYNKSNMTLMDIVLERGLIGGYYDDDDVDDEWYCYDDDDDESSAHNEVSDTAYKDDDGDSIIQWLLVKIILHDNVCIFLPKLPAAASSSFLYEPRLLTLEEARKATLNNNNNNNNNT